MIYINKTHTAQYIPAPQICNLHNIIRVYVMHKVRVLPISMNNITIFKIRQISPTSSEKNRCIGWRRKFQIFVLALFFIRPSKMTPLCFGYSLKKLSIDVFNKFHFIVRQLRENCTMSLTTISEDILFVSKMKYVQKSLSSVQIRNRIRITKCSTDMKEL